MNRSFIQYLPSIPCIRLFVPMRLESDQVSDWPNTYFEFNLENGTWTRHERKFSVSGEHTVTTGVTWDAPVEGTWDDEEGTWDSSTLLLANNVPIYGDEKGMLYEEDDGLKNDGEAAIDGWVDTKDFTGGDNYKRQDVGWMEMNFEAKGDEVDVYYSVDAGLFYTFLETVTLDANWKVYELSFAVHSPQIRFRFRNNTLDETFQLRYLELGFIPSTTVETEQK